MMQRIRAEKALYKHAKYTPKPPDTERLARLEYHTHRIRHDEARLRAMGLDPMKVPAGLADRLLRQITD